MRKIISCSPHAFQQRFCRVKNIGYIICNEQALKIYLYDNNFYEPIFCARMMLSLRRTLVHSVILFGIYLNHDFSLIFLICLIIIFLFQGNQIHQVKIIVQTIAPHCSERTSE